jgi:hypothetical protein
VENSKISFPYFNFREKPRVSVVVICPNHLSGNASLE